MYSSLLPDSRLTSVKVISGTPSGDCELVRFAMAGQPFLAISAGPLYRFNPAVSFQITCRTHHEAQSLWEALSPGGNVLMPLAPYPFSEKFGWIEDRYGLSWQILLLPGTSPAQRVTPVLTFAGGVHGKAEEAIRFYASVFSGFGQTQAAADVLARYGENEAPEREGTVRYARFTLNGLQFAAMDSARSHNFQFNEAVSFLVSCETQDEIDYFWSKLSAYPNAERCGWLKDQYGLSWQIVPIELQRLLNGDDHARSQRVTQALLGMKKFDIAALRAAAAGERI